MDGEKDGREKKTLAQKRRMLVRSKAFSVMDRMSRTNLLHPVLEMESFDSGPDGNIAFPSLPDNVLKMLGLYGKYESEKNLNEPDVEEQFAKLSLAFKTDKYTLSKRLGLQQRQRDIAEENIDAELKSLRESLNVCSQALNQLCTDSDMREVITKTQQHVDIVQQTTMRMSSRAETFGAIQQEERMNCAFETMLNYVEHLKILYDKEHMELEEYRRLLAEHNLLPEERKPGDTADEPKRVLPPRSHSLSSSSKPVFQRRGSLGTFIRPPLNDCQRQGDREAVAPMPPLRPPMEPRGRLLSYVCLLNTSSESNRSSNGATSSSSNLTLSPKSRRASLPVGPMATSAHQPTNFSAASLVADFRSSDPSKAARDESEREKSVADTNSGKDPASLPSKPEDRKEEPNHEVSSAMTVSSESTNNKDSSISQLTDGRSELEEQVFHNAVCPQSGVSEFDSNDSSADCKEICIPTTRTNCLNFLKLLHPILHPGAFHWDGGTLILHVRYLLSALLAAAALFSLILTFLPNSMVVGFSIS